MFFATPWPIQSMEFSRPEYWSGQPFPSPGDLPNPGVKSRSPALQADSLPAEPPGKPIFFSITVYHRILNVVPCAVQWDLIVYHISFFLIYIFFVYFSCFIVLARTCSGMLNRSSAVDVFAFSQSSGGNISKV